MTDQLKTLNLLFSIHEQGSRASEAGQMSQPGRAKRSRIGDLSKLTTLFKSHIRLLTFVIWHLTLVCHLRSVILKVPSGSNWLNLWFNNRLLFKIYFFRFVWWGKVNYILSSKIHLFRKKTVWNDQSNNLPITFHQVLQFSRVTEQWKHLKLSTTLPQWSANEETVNFSFVC